MTTPALARPVIEITQDANGQYALLVDGEPFFANAVGGYNQLEELVALGGNSFRTWGAEELEIEIKGMPLLDYAQSLGLMVVPGIWLGHERHGFSYRDPKQRDEQREHVREVITQYRDHPAILAWGLGNEMEGPADDDSKVYIWQEVNHLAEIIKEIDPSRPIMTVIAGTGGQKVANVTKYCPAIDILGVNAYGSAPMVGADVVRQGWNKPFMLTEFGPIGHWEVGTAPWGAPIEPTSQDKAATYYTTHMRVVEEGQGRCLGTFAFLWGNKQETTATWYGMYLKSGERTGAVDAMAYAWTGKFPPNRAPKLSKLASEAKLARVSRNSRQTAMVEIVDPEGDTLDFEWIVKGESTDRRVGGDAEAAPPEYPELTLESKGTEVVFRASSQPGAYRLFVTIRDGAGGAATANFPFYVQ